MRRLSTKTNVLAPEGSYPYGRIKDNPGDNTGTPVNEQVYGDFHQFFEKLMADAGITANDLPENSANGFQLNEALNILFPKSNLKVALRHLNFSWNMDTTDFITVAHGISDLTKIKNIQCVIWNNAATALYGVPVVPFGLSATDDAGIILVDATNITISRRIGGNFDSASFNSGGNRGSLTIQFAY